MNEAPASRREAAKAAKAAPAPTAAAEGPTRATRGRTVLKVVVGLLLALVWIRFVLFAWLFPIVERRFDSPEIAPAEAESVESLGEVLSLTAWAAGA